VHSINYEITIMTLKLIDSGGTPATVAGIVGVGFSKLD